jgi:hypothetical protein
MSIVHKILSIAIAATLVCNISGCAKALIEPKEAPANFVPPIEIEIDDFIEGNLYFTAYHELGHAFVSEYELPIAGREEDAVDRLAAWLMTPEDDSPPDYLMGAIRGWFMTNAEISLDEIAWWGAHGTDGQRAYQLACMLYGANPEAHRNVAEIVELPDDRREACEYEAAENERVWKQFLSDHMRPNGESGANKQDVTIVYASTEEYEDDAAYLRKLGLMEDIAKVMTEDYRFQPGIKLEARECGEANAYWSSENRTLTFCYEEVAAYRNLAKKLQPAVSGAN